MRRSTGFLLTTLLLLSGLMGGCARAARDTTGFALEHAVTVPASFEDAWQAVKRVLREQGYEIYTRDKRGVFVAFTQMNRKFLQPNRLKLTVTLDHVSDAQTAIRIETRKQKYGVSALTYPGWHDRRATGAQSAEAILEAVQQLLLAPSPPAGHSA